MQFGHFSNMEIIVNKSSQLKLKAFGIYQIFGGVIGLILTVWVISKLVTIPTILLLLLLVPTTLYTYSIFCGILLLKKNISGLTHSLANQFLQLVNFSILGLSLQYVSGVFLSIGFDLTNSLLITFNLGFSSWQLTINDDIEPFTVNFNFIALVLIIFSRKLKKKIYSEEVSKQIKTIGK